MKIYNVFNIVLLFWWAKKVALWGGSHCEEVAISKNPQAAKKVSFTAWLLCMYQPKSHCNKPPKNS